MADKKCLTYRKAYDALRARGARLMLMHTSSDNQYFVIPGGKVALSDAHKLLEEHDIEEFDDGLFPGNPQSWRIRVSNAGG